MIHDIAYYRKIQGMNDTSNAKEAEIRQIKSEVARDFSNTLDCEDVTVNGTSAKLLITKTQDDTIKKVVAHPDNALFLGDMVNWLSTNWLVDTVDSDTRITYHGKMRRCNVLLKWLDENGAIQSRYGFCEDATKYSDGVKNTQYMSVAEFKLRVTISLDKDTSKLSRGKRFLLDATQYIPDIESAGGHCDAFEITGRNAVTDVVAGHGKLNLILSYSEASRDGDNTTLMIADYFKPTDVYTLSTNVTSPLSLTVGTDYTLAVTATLNCEAYDQTLIWYHSDNTAVATVTSGVITAVASGECKITVKAGNVTEEFTVKVVESQAGLDVRISAADGSNEIIYGTTKRLNVGAYYDGERVPYELESSIESLLHVADIVEESADYLIIQAVDNEAFIGEQFTVTTAVSGDSASIVLTVRGWM